MSALHDEILIWVKLKGFATAEALANQLCLPKDRVDMVLAALVESGQAKQVPLGIKLRPNGSEAALHAWDAERARTNQVIMAGVVKDFAALDRVMQPLLSDWKMKKTPDGPVRNLHQDHAYDDALVERALALSADARRMVESLATQVPRCAAYARRLTRAEQKVACGNLRYISSSLLDSIETVWWELRQDMLVLAKPDRLVCA
ncbi:MAG: hypothetical protein AAF862_10475 [Pseudomonadota bacterium]